MKCHEKVLNLAENEIEQEEEFDEKEFENLFVKIA